MLKLNNFLDDILGGGLEDENITTIFGPPSAGKTTICFQYVISCLKQNKKVIYIDTEGGFSPLRLKQMNPDIDLKNIIVFSPKSFEEQQKVVLTLNKQIKNNLTIGLVIFDSLVMLYRLKLGDSPQKVNSNLGEQLRLLTQVSRTFKIPILVTNQMYVLFDTKEKKMVGGMLLEYWSKTILEIEFEDIREIILRKHKTKKEGQKTTFIIENKGIIKSQKRSFNFFK